MKNELPSYPKSPVPPEIIIANSFLHILPEKNFTRVHVYIFFLSIVMRIYNTNFFVSFPKKYLIT